MSSIDMHIDAQQLQALDKVLNQRYSKRLHKFGRDPRTLGWDTRENQWARFYSAFRYLPETTSSIVDIGCGLADFYSFLCEQRPDKLWRYTGLDINSELIEHCRQNFTESQFICTNLLTDTLENVVAQWGVMFGVLNFRLQDIDNEVFAREMITTAFDLVEEGLIVDMLSAERTADYPEEDFVYYYSPTKLLEFTLQLTPYCLLIHDYSAIPQREFMLVLRKQPCK